MGGFHTYKAEVRLEAFVEVVFEVPDTWSEDEIRASISDLVPELLLDPDEETREVTHLRRSEPTLGVHGVVLDDDDFVKP